MPKYKVNIQRQSRVITFEEAIVEADNKDEAVELLQEYEWLEDEDKMKVTNRREGKVKSYCEDSCEDVEEIK